VKKTKLVMLESADGEIHFQECKAKFCVNAKEYNAAEALKIAKKEANKPLLLKKKINIKFFSVKSYGVKCDKY
jgi:hypothetical protein